MLLNLTNVVSRGNRSYGKCCAKLSSDFQNACTQNISKASELDKLLQPLHSSLFIESNPSPVKYVPLLGMCKPSVRLPLVEIREETKKKVSDALKVAKLL